MTENRGSQVPDKQPKKKFQVDVHVHVPLKISNPFTVSCIKSVIVSRSYKYLMIW